MLCLTCLSWPGGIKMTKLEAAAIIAIIAITSFLGYDMHRNQVTQAQKSEKPTARLIRETSQETKPARPYVVVDSYHPHYEMRSMDEVLELPYYQPGTHFVDIDGDGDQDMVILSGGKMRIVENNIPQRGKPGELEAKKVQAEKVPESDK